MVHRMELEHYFQEFQDLVKAEGIWEAPSGRRKSWRKKKESGKGYDYRKKPPGQGRTKKNQPVPVPQKMSAPNDPMTQVGDILSKQYREAIHARDWDAAVNARKQYQSYMKLSPAASLSSGRTMKHELKVLDAKRRRHKKKEKGTTQQAKAAKQQERQTSDKPYQFTSVNQLAEKPGHKLLGKGQNGEVHFDKGPPPVAVKYGRLSKEEAEISQIASDVGVGPKVYNLELGKGKPDKSGVINDSKMAMEFLDGHEVVYKLLLAESSKDDEEELDFDFSYMSPEQKKNTITGIANVIRSMGKLHEQKVAHNDFHLNNCMVGPNGSGKIIDFGFSSKGKARHMESDLHSEDYEICISVLRSYLSRDGYNELNQLYMNVTNIKSDSNKERYDAIMKFHSSVDEILTKEGL